MKTICLNFQVHQPIILKRYRFFNIGNDHHYYDKHLNESGIHRIAKTSYLPANRVLLEAINQCEGKLKVSFTISGTVLDLFESYAPEVLQSFRILANTGCVEFVGTTNAYSYAALANTDEFTKQVNTHKQKIMKHFGMSVGKIFCNSNMLYANSMGKSIENLGFRGVLIEGCQHILGWKSPNYLYNSATNPRLKLLLRHHKLNNDICLNFSNHSWNEFPLTAEKYIHWLEQLDPKEEVINISLDYSTFGEKHAPDTGIFDFLRDLPRVAINKKLVFATPTELLHFSSVAPLSIPHPVIWACKEKGRTVLSGNEMQKEAFYKLYDLAERVKQTPCLKIKTDWEYLQTSDHFRLMNMDADSSDTYMMSGSYISAYDAFINYVNILTDFSFRLKFAIPVEINEPAYFQENKNDYEKSQ